MDNKTIIKLFYAGCGTTIAVVAMFLGFDGKLALTAVALLFGGEKVLDKLLKSD